MNERQLQMHIKMQMIENEFRFDLDEREEDSVLTISFRFDDFVLERHQCSRASVALICSICSNPSCTSLYTLAFYTTCLPLIHFARISFHPSLAWTVSIWNSHMISKTNSPRRRQVWRGALACLTSEKVFIVRTCEPISSVIAFFRIRFSRKSQWHGQSLELCSNTTTSLRHGESLYSTLDFLHQIPLIVYENRFGGVDQRP